MRFLLDTQVLVWLLTAPEKIFAAVLALLQDEANILFFSSISIWEVAIKQRLGRESFRIRAPKVYQEALAIGLSELVLTSLQGLQTLELPLLHGDPFDRILLAQAISEQMTLVTADQRLAKYDGPVLRVCPA